MAPSEELLREFARTGSDEAFREIVQRHVNLVYAAARRAGAGDAHFAEDVTQMVFRDLALKARALPRGTVVAGWLYRHASFTASKMLRSDRRRAAREEKAVEMSPNGDTPVTLEQIEPALARLSDAERDAIVLRYLEERDWAEVGASLGVSVDAAQKRASRALDKLRSLLERDGLKTSSAALAVALAVRSQTAPGALASQIATNALANLSNTMSPGLLTSFKMKLAVAAAAGIAVSTPLLWQWNQLNTARADNNALRQQIVGLRHDLDALGNRDAELAELERLRRENAELHKLRADYTALRIDMDQLARTRATPEEPKPVEKPPEPRQVQVSSRLAEVPEEAFAEIQALGIRVPVENGAEVLNMAQVQALEKFLNERTGVDFLTAPKVTTLDGRQARISVEEVKKIDGTDIPLGPVVDVLPTLSPNGAVTTLRIEAQLTEFLGYGQPETETLPKFRVRRASTEGRLGKGDAILMRGQTLEGEAEDRKLLVLVSSMVIWPDGSPYEPAAQ